MYKFKSRQMSKSITKKAKNYEYRFKSFNESENLFEKIDINTIKNLSLKNLEPIWLYSFRLQSFKYFNCMKIPKWSVFLSNFDLNITYYSAPLLLPYSIKNDTTDSLNTKTAVDIVYDSISINNSYNKELNKYGIIFNNISDSIKNFPDLLSYYLGSIVIFILIR